MAKQAEAAPAAGPGTGRDDGGNGFFREWVVPIVLGVAIGGGIMWVFDDEVRGAWRSCVGVFQSGARAIVDRWEYDAADANEGIAGELRALGPSARADVVGALRDLPGEHVEVKVWVGCQLAGEPWFDTASLKEIVRDGKSPKEDRRAAACALVDTQSKEVDTELVLPVFEEWLGDADAADRGMAISRLDRMWRAGMLSSAWETRVTRALIRLAARGAAAKSGDAERLADDRAFALLTLELALADAEVKKLLWTVAKDETDEDMPRVNAVRALSEGGVLDAADVDDWAAAAKSSNGVVRQTVADNLQRSALPEFDRVLAPLCFDANPLARTGALDTQIKRRRPTMLDRFDELMEDSDEWVRFGAMFAAGAFKNVTENQGARAAMILRLVESSEDPVDVMGGVLAMKLLTDQVYGLQPADVHLRERDVEETALRAFVADKAGRKEAAGKWRAHFGASAVWTAADRVKTLEKLLHHADPKNAERAKAVLGELKKN